jgi:hypothetical protein
MQAMRGNPPGRRPFQRECAAKHQKVFHKLVGFEAAMAEQAVIAQGNAQATSGMYHDDKRDKAGPCKGKRCSQRQAMNDNERNQHGRPEISGGRVSGQKCHYDGVSFSLKANLTKKSEVVLKPRFMTTGC